MEKATFMNENIPIVIINFKKPTEIKFYSTV